MTAEVFEKLLAAGWFPFAMLSDNLVRDMAAHVQVGWDLDELLRRISAEIQARLPDLRDRISAAPYFDQHRTVLLKALDHFGGGDFMSCTALLYPRLEGVLRSRQISRGASSFKPADLTVVALTPSRPRHRGSLLIVEGWERYLTVTFFPTFDPTAPADVTRHTVAHGVAPEGELPNEKHAAVGVLVLDQLCYMFA